MRDLSLSRQEERNGDCHLGRLLSYVLHQLLVAHLHTHTRTHIHTRTHAHTQIQLRPPPASCGTPLGKLLYLYMVKKQRASSKERTNNGRNMTQRSPSLSSTSGATTSLAELQHNNRPVRITTQRPPRPKPHKQVTPSCTRHRRVCVLCAALGIHPRPNLHGTLGSNR